MRALPGAAVDGQWEAPVARGFPPVQSLDDSQLLWQQPSVHPPPIPPHKLLTAAPAAPTLLPVPAAPNALHAFCCSGAGRRLWGGGGCGSLQHAGGAGAQEGVQQGKGLCSGVLCVVDVFLCCEGWGLLGCVLAGLLLELELREREGGAECVGEVVSRAQRAVWFKSSSQATKQTFNVQRPWAPQVNP